jgi:hypothetical protein
MTTRTRKAIHFNVSPSTGWKDAFVVSALAIVLGAFVAQISTTPKHTSASQPMASASLKVTSNGLG